MEQVMLGKFRRDINPPLVSQLISFGNCWDSIFLSPVAAKDSRLGCVLPLAFVLLRSDDF
jgi:hypothetical protein